MMKGQLLKLVDQHNAVIDALTASDLPVLKGKLLMAMGVWHKRTCEGADITHLARENGIDVKRMRGICRRPAASGLLADRLGGERKSESKNRQERCL